MLNKVSGFHVLLQGKSIIFCSPPVPRKAEGTIDNIKMGSIWTKLGLQFKRKQLLQQLTIFIKPLPNTNTPSLLCQNLNRKSKTTKTAKTATRIKLMLYLSIVNQIKINSTMQPYLLFLMSVVVAQNINKMSLLQIVSTLFHMQWSQTYSRAEIIQIWTNSSRSIGLVVLPLQPYRIRRYYSHLR